MTRGVRTLSDQDWDVGDEIDADRDIAVDFRAKGHSGSADSPVGPRAIERPELFGERFSPNVSAPLT